MAFWQTYHLLALILGGKDLETHIHTANTDGYWPDLIQLSSQQMVTSQLAVLFKSQPKLWTMLGEEETAYFDEILSLNQKRNKRLITQTKTVISGLNAQGISPLVMKGTATLLNPKPNHLTQQHLGYRMQIDVDLLVKKEDLDNSLHEMKKQGYQYAKEAKNSLQAIKPDQEKRLLSLYQNHKHLPPFIKDTEIASVELHRHLYMKQYRKHYDLNAIWGRAIRIEQASLSWYELCFDDELQLLLMSNYIEPRLKPSYSLPLKLIRDYLDLIFTSNESVIDDMTHLKPQLNMPEPSKFSQSTQELCQLILIISGHWSSQRPPSKAVGHYIDKFQTILEKPSSHRFAHYKAALVRQLLNFSHDTRLILRYFL